MATMQFVDGMKMNMHIKIEMFSYYLYSTCGFSYKSSA